MFDDKIDLNIVKKINEKGTKAYPRYCCRVCNSPYGGYLYLKQYPDYDSCSLDELYYIMSMESFKYMDKDFREYIEERFFHVLSYKRPDIYKLYKELTNNIDTK